MRGYIDLHCHWVAGIDDGARTTADSVAMLRALHQVGFDTVMATPHMRTGMFDNSREELEQAFAHSLKQVSEHPDLPSVALSSEHHLDDLVFAALMDDRGLPYPPGHAALVEFPNQHFPLKHEHRLYELRVKKRIRPVLAHPERYRPVWKDIASLDPILDGGTVLLLDVGALVGKYGRASRKAAEKLLKEGYYYAACSDAHRASDAEAVGKGIERLHKLMGREEAEFLLIEGPKNILAGTVAD